MQPRKNFIGALVFVALALLLVLRALGVFPTGLDDLLSRASGALVVLIGLALLLRNRVPFSGVIAVIISLVLVGGVAAVAFVTRSGQISQDQRVPIAESIGTDVSLLQITLETLDTDLEITLAESRGSLSGEFLGSLQSQVDFDYVEDDAGRGTFILRETKPEPFPLLSEVGRGRLRLVVPPEVAIDMTVIANAGDATFNLSGASLERLNLDLQTGNVLLTMPEYEPRSPIVQEQPGTLTIRNGALTLFIPEAVAARLEIESAQEPDFDPTVYEYIRGVLLENRRFTSAEILIRYTLIVPRGLITVETVP
ncbi:MAG: hypothetical protein MUF87_00045 [Anaerolineae bacterium]|jgi:hypothetical protein|nr:hypothetical protein [Anaerolineae bacterium]